uniref:Uncharacterized protein n=1 Tax=Lotharella oceanica TaxID=641309 RepID=A0A7S2XJD8_9EUKA
MSEENVMDTEVYEHPPDGEEAVGESKQEGEVLQMDMEGNADAKVYADQKHESGWAGLYHIFAELDEDRIGSVSRSELKDKVSRLEDLFQANTIALEKIDWQSVEDIVLSDFLSQAMDAESGNHELFTSVYDLLIKIDEKRDGEILRPDLVSALNDHEELKEILSNAGRLDGLGRGGPMTFDDFWTMIIQAREAKNQSMEIPKKKRTTTRYLTKYERARVLGTRALQISLGAPVLVELGGETDPLQIAMKELKDKKIPIIIRRFLPSGKYEDWPIDDPELIVT